MTGCHVHGVLNDVPSGGPPPSVIADTCYLSDARMQTILRGSYGAEATRILPPVGVPVKIVPGKRLP